MWTDRFYDALLTAFGPQHWWPVTWGSENGPWEIAVGAVLTQNTNWNNVERALIRLEATDCTTAREVLAISNEALAETIRPAGYYNLKAKRLKALADWWTKNADSGFDHEIPTAELRADLLGVYGVGPETADSILLYAFQRPSFVIDAYTKRVLTRHGLAHSRTSYDEMKDLFEHSLAPDPKMFNEYHALLVALAKTHCQTKPLCEDCPLASHLHSRA